MAQSLRNEVVAVAQRLRRGTVVHLEPSDPHKGTACGLEDWWEYRCDRDHDQVTCKRCLRVINGPAPRKPTSPVYARVHLLVDEEFGAACRQDMKAAPTTSDLRAVTCQNCLRAEAAHQRRMTTPEPEWMSHVHVLERPRDARTVCRRARERADSRWRPRRSEVTCPLCLRWIERGGRYRTGAIEGRGGRC